MRCELRVTSGARTGHREVFEKPYIGIGRHPMSDLRFDAEKDLDASTRHAAIIKDGDKFLLKDLGSTNGTFLNGERLTADRVLSDGDVMRFGVHGPEVAFGIVLDEGEEVVMPAVQAPPAPAPVPAAPAPAAPAAPAAPPAGADARQKKSVARTAPETPALERPGATPPSRTAVLRAEIGAQQSRYRVLGIVLVILVLGALGIVIWQGRTANTQIVQRDTTIRRISAELAVLRAAQAAADSQKTALEAQLAAERDPARRSALQGQIASVDRRSAAIQQARDVDYGAIRRANARAVAVLYVRFPDTTQMWTGTAFSVSTSGVMLTNRHLVVNAAGEQPRDIAVQFSGSADVLPARLVRTAPDADLAVLQLESTGPFPSVLGMEPANFLAGAPIALLGFPGGGGTGTPNATLTTGSITAVSDSVIELDAFSGTGASGSPILDRNGRVVGVLFGGRGGGSSREIVGLPIRRAMALLQP